MVRSFLHAAGAKEVNHLLIASETISTEDIWEPLAEGDLIGIDAQFRFVRQRRLPDDAQAWRRVMQGFYKRDGQDVRHARAIGLSQPG